MESEFIKIVAGVDPSLAGVLWAYVIRGYIEMFLAFGLVGGILLAAYKALKGAK